jgi:hypothetical protein
MAASPAHPPILGVLNNTVDKNSKSSLTSLNQPGIVRVNNTQPSSGNDKNTLELSANLSSNINLSKGANSENKNPKIAVGEKSNIYIVWENYTENQILFSRSTDDGASFSSPIVINKVGDGNEPQLAVSGKNVYVIWEKRNNMISFSRSTDDGASFSSPITWGNESSSDIQKAAVLLGFIAKALSKTQ